MSFENKTAVITGAASGIGLLSAQCFAREGANVVLLDVNEEAVSAKTQEITQEGYSAVYYKTDVTDYQNIVAALNFAKEQFGSIDIVVNAAGGSAPRIWNRPVEEEFKDIPIEVFDWGLDVNLKGPFYMAHAVMHHMAQQGSGVIINFGSVTGEEGDPHSVEYSTAKSGVMNGLTKSVAIYGAKYGVRCVCVAPGPVLTRAAMANMKTLMGRAAETQEIVDLVMYLASDKAAFMTGITVLIDGGRLVLKSKE